MADTKSLGTRMKEYESVTRDYLMRRTPAIVRIDGKAFHSFTRGFDKPYDEVLFKSMCAAAQSLCADVQGCKLAYVQSDEISLLLTDYDTLATSAWFDGNIQKIVSISASTATLSFNEAFRSNANEFGMSIDYILEPELMAEDKKFKLYMKYIQRIATARFDSRVFNLPKEEVCNYFIWRQQDAVRNSIEGLGQKYFSAKQLDGKNQGAIQDMLFKEHGINWNNIPINFKRGACVKRQLTAVQGRNGIVYRNKWVVDMEIPTFTTLRDYIDQHVFSPEVKE